MTQLNWQLKWLALALLILVALAGCVAPTRPAIVAADAEKAQIAREARLAMEVSWSFSGRIALSRGKEGGSGRIDWRQDGKDFEITLTAPVTGQSWRLRREAGVVRIEGINGGPRVGSDAEALLLETTGWRVPVGAMESWVRGARAPGEASIAYDGSGWPLRIEQAGWTIEFRAWNAAEPRLPLKLFARQRDASVRLVVDRWGTP